MAPSKTKSRYSLLGAEDADIGSESDTTACSVGSMGKMRTSRKETQLSTKSIPRVELYLTWLRWGFVVVLQALILVVLLVRKSDGGCPLEVETGGDINGLYRPSKYIRVCGSLYTTIVDETLN
jgi:hypothetical protein